MPRHLVPQALYMYSMVPAVGAGKVKRTLCAINRYYHHSTPDRRRILYGDHAPLYEHTVLRYFQKSLCDVCRIVLGEVSSPRPVSAGEPFPSKKLCLRQITRTMNRYIGKTLESLTLETDYVIGTILPFLRSNPRGSNYASLDVFSSQAKPR